MIIVLLTNRRAVMGDRVNGAAINTLGWVTTAAILAATLGLIWTWVR